MRSLLAISVLAAALAAPATAGAGVVQSLKSAKLQRVTGSLTITESRCPPGSSECGKSKLEAAFDGGVKPRTKSEKGPAGFPLGARISGRGSGECSAESPSTVLTGPDGSVQFLSGASRLDPGTFASTRIAAFAGKRGVRIAWLEPLTPGLVCDYFEEPGTVLALPATPALPRTLVSPYLNPRALARKRFSITIAGSQDWTEQATDGTKVAGTAGWRLRLDYRRK
jgi:hypothetical protein